MMTFSQYTSKNIRIDQDNNGLIALVPDQSGQWMTVRCVESKTSVQGPKDYLPVQWRLVLQW